MRSCRLRLLASDGIDDGATNPDYCVNLMSMSSDVRYNNAIRFRAQRTANNDKRSVR